MDEEKAQDILRAWGESAAYWDRNRDVIRSMFEPITSALLGEAGVSKGDSVLDVAGGTGQPSIAIAEVVGPSGEVVCTDAVAEMVRAAEEEARRLGLRNIRFRQCPADSLPFKDDEFDLSVSRLGLMFFPQPVAALKEMLRVIRPGGRVALAVWAGREFNPFFRVVSEVISRYTEPEPEEPDAPGAFRFEAPGAVSNLLRQAGAREVVEREFDFHIEAAVTLKDFWRVRSELSDTLREKMGRLSREELSRATEEISSAMRSYFPDDRMKIPARVIVATGAKAVSK
ncbi:MAG TPA: methyltransferase domain-containing protein [Blastocatellia bacterium]|jgi:ubiquinone/menaquinone biosynthesis C-methylase UbiE|nr:methyltransferase domain-containing protein [Blastocatellia bacterium]